MKPKDSSPGIRQEFQVGWPPDPPLVEAARTGDRKALEAILRVSSAKLGGFFLARGCTFDESQDLTSETLTRVVANLGRLRQARAYAPWMWSLGRSAFREWVRNEAASRRLRSYRMADTAADPTAAMDIQADHRQIAGAFRALKPSDQLVLWLRDVEGFSYDQIGESRGGTGLSARVATHRARRRLHELYLTA